VATYEYTLSCGVFGLPPGATSVDWMLLNNSDSEQHFRVVVYNVGVGIVKAPAPPGAVESTLAPQTLTHNANSVGQGKPFSGSPIEVVVEVNDRRMLPAVEVWSDTGGTVIPGTRIGPDQFVPLH
jgi:hypothetical protein